MPPIRSRRHDRYAPSHSGTSPVRVADLEEAYLGLEGRLEQLAPIKPYSRILGAPIDTSVNGRYSIKVITEKNTRQGAKFACELAMKRKRAGGKGKLTCTSKYNMLREADEFFRGICEETAKSYPELRYENFIFVR